jgi:hypothetical protein
MAVQQHNYYFTELTKGESKKLEQRGYIYGYTPTTSAVLTNTVNSLVSYPIGFKSSSDTIPRNHFAGKKILVGIDVTTAYDAVAAVLSVSASLDSINWTDVATAIANTTPNITGVKLGLVDLTSIAAPYFRLTFNSSGLICGILGKLKFLYGIPAPGEALTSITVLS